MKSAPDEQLVRQAQHGDKTAFAELFANYEGRIFGYLYRLVGDRAWAEDLAQEAFIRAHQHLGRLGPPYDFKSWVYRIASNLALDGLRRYRREAPLPDWDSGEAAAPEPADSRREGDPERQSRLAELRAAVWRTLHQLPDTYRQILVLREIDGLSYKEIAAILDISLNNVRVTLHRARTQFRDLHGLQVMAEEGRMACQGLDELLSAYVDGELDRAGRKRVKAHIAACPVCQKRRRDLLAVSSLLAALVPVFPPPTLRPRFLKRLKRLPSPSKVGDQTPGRSGLHKNIAGQARQSPVFWWLLGFGGGAIILLTGAAVLGLLLLPRLGVFVAPTSTPILGEVEGPATTPTPPVAPAATPTPTSTSLAAPTSTPAATSPPPTPAPTSTATPIPATLTPTPTPSLTPAPHIRFWTDATTVQAGVCTTVRWETENVQAVFFDGQGVPGVGSHQACPCTAETHTLDVLLRDGAHDVRTLTINVTGSCTTPTPDTQGPPAPQPLAPVDAVILSCRSSATLSWSPVSDPSGIAGYHVRLEEIIMTRPPRSWTWGALKETQLSVPVACGLPYHWAVRAEDGQGNLGPWSERAQFGVGVN